MNAICRCLAIFVVLVAASKSDAMIMMRYPDDVVAKAPIVVIGHWIKAPGAQDVRFKEGDYAPRFEHQSRLVVTQVLHGQLATGVYPLLQGAVRLGEPQLYVSGESYVEVRDVTGSCLWFLEWARSTNRNDKTRYLRIKLGEYVQEMKFARYYEILRRPDRVIAISECLRTSDPEIVERSLRFSCGWSEPWPFTPFSVLWDPQSQQYWASHKHSPPRQLLPDIANVVNGRFEECRPLAAAILALAAGQSNISVLRTLLPDHNLRVAAVAAGYLVRLKDVSSVGGISDVCVRLQDPSLCCELARAMRISKQAAFVPVLISLLGSRLPQEGGYNDGDPSTPALCAQSALQGIIGFTFPPDADASAAAWNKVRAMPDPAARIAQLRSLLGDWVHPLKATYRPLRNTRGHLMLAGLERDSNDVVVEFTVKNISTHRVTLSKAPSTIDMNQAHLIGYDLYGLQTLRPKRSFHFRGAVSPDLVKSPGFGISLGYFDRWDRGSPQAWVGSLKARRQR